MRHVIAACVTPGAFKKARGAHELHGGWPVAWRLRRCRLSKIDGIIIAERRAGYGNAKARAVVCGARTFNDIKSMAKWRRRHRETKCP